MIIYINESAEKLTKYHDDDEYHLLPFKGNAMITLLGIGYYFDNADNNYHDINFLNYNLC